VEVCLGQVSAERSYVERDCNR